MVADIVGEDVGDVEIVSVTQAPISPDLIIPCENERYFCTGGHFLTFDTYQAIVTE